MDSIIERARQEAGWYRGPRMHVGTVVDREVSAFIDGATFAATITLAEVDAARDRVVVSGNKGWAPHVFVYALLEELGFEVAE